MEKCCLKKTAGLVGGGFMAALFALLSFALFSCSNMSGGGSSSSKNSYPVVRFVANMQSDLAAAPQEISGLVSASAGDAAFCDDGISRSAMPDVEITFGTDIGVKYYVEAVTGTKGTDSYKRHFVSGTSSTLELPLESGRTWNVTCGIGVLRAISAPSGGGMEYHVQTVYMSDNDPSVTISPDNPVYTKTFGLKPSTEGSGKVDLTFYVDSETGIDDASCLVVECADLNIAEDFTKGYGSGKIVFSTDPGKTVPSGCYEFVIKFLSSSGVLLYATSQTINVFDNMTTNSWRDDGSGAFKTATVEGKSILVFTVDDALIKQFVDTTIYVGKNEYSSDDSDENAGTAFTPLSSLRAAFKKIEAAAAAGTVDKDYNIYVSGTLRGNYLIGDSGIEGKVKSISIMGLKGAKAPDVLLGASSANAPVITINTTVPIKFRDIQITGGTGSEGGGINIKKNGADVTLESGALVGDDTESLATNASGGHGNIASINGGGIFLKNGKLLLKSGSKVCRNYAGGSDSDTSSGGGGICVRGGEVTIQRGAKVMYNCTGCRGGGIYLVDGDSADQDITLNINGGDICNNASGIFGGGVFVGAVRTGKSKTVNFTSGKISYNKSKCLIPGYGPNGGAVFMDGGRFCMTGGEVCENVGGFNDTDKAITGGIHFLGHKVSEGFEPSQLELRGGEIKGNYPRAVAMVGDAEKAFYLGGSVLIPNSAKVDGVDKTGANMNDIFLDKSDSVQTKISLTRELSKHSKDNPIALTVDSGTAKRGAVLVEASGLSSLKNSKDCFVLTGDDWELKLSSDKKTLTLDSPIWVAGTGAQQCTGSPSEAGPGTKSHPYDTIEHACNAMTDSSVEYTILIDGTLTAKQFFKSCFAASISIEGANGLYPAGHEKAGEPMDAIDGSGIANNQKDYMLYIGRAFDITIKNLKITGGDRSGKRNEGNIEGGGIFLNSGKTLTLSSGTLITKNKAGHGGGVYVQDSTLVIEDGAKITKNTANGGGAVYNFGGGVYLKKNNGKPVLKMSGGEISGNSARKGGGVCLYYASFFMYGNAIIGADLPEGQVGSSDTDKGCNTANCGGGIYLEGSDVYLGYEDASEDGSPKTPHKLEKGVIGNYSYGISDTATTYGGGGIYWSYNSNGKARIYMASGQIAKNTAEQKGGAIYYDSGSNTTSTLTIGGDASIPALAGANDVCLLSPATLAGALTKHGASNPITITPEGGKMTHGAIVFKTDPERVLTSDDLKCFKLSAEKEAAGLDLTLSSNNKSIKLDKPIYVKQGGTPSGSGTADGSKTKPYASVQAATAGINNESLDYTIKIDACEEPLTGGQYIASDAKANSILVIGANGLYPAGHEKAGQPKDCIQGGTFSSSAANVKNLKIQNLKITGHVFTSATGGKGGGVYSSGNTTLTLCAGTLVTENKANTGGGVYKKGGTLVIESGAVIKGNSAVTEGYNEAWGSAENKKIGFGGGIYLDEETSLVMSGGTICSNYAENKGGGMYVESINQNSGVFIYGDAVIGGIPSTPTYPLTESNALAAGGNSAPQGGGIYMMTGVSGKARLYLGYSQAENDSYGTPKTPTVSDAFTGRISGNYASSKGGGIYLDYAKLYYNSGEISYNNSYQGAGIHSYCGNVKMSGGTIANNCANVSNVWGYGGAVYSYGDFTLTSNPCTAYIPYGINDSVGRGKNDFYLYNSSKTIKIDEGALLTMASPIATIYVDTYSRGRAILSGLSGSNLDYWCEHFALTNDEWAIGGEGKIVSALPLTVTYDLNITDAKAAPAASAFSLVDALFESSADNHAVIDEDNLFITNILKPSYDGFVGTGDKIFKFAGWDANNDGTADITIDPDATSFYYPDNFLDYVAATAHAITLKAVWTEDTSPSDDTLEAVYSNITYNSYYYNDHDEFKLYTAEQAKQVFSDLRGKYFAERNISTGAVTAGTEKTITLMSDIDLGSMAPSCEIFCGILDGNGHTLTASISKNNSGNGCGLFQANHGTVKNLTLAGTITASGSVHFVGGICGSNNGTIDNCTVTATVKATSYSSTDPDASVGGIAGKSFKPVTNCTFSGTLEGGGKRAVGGVVGYAISGSVTGNKVASSATIKYTGTDTTGASIGPIIGKGDASGNTVESGATIDGGVLEANAIGY